MKNESEIICKICTTIPEIYHKSLYVKVIQWIKKIDQKTIDFDITQNKYLNNGINNVADVFRVLAYDCNIFVFLCSTYVTFSNKSCYIVLDIVVDVITCKNY